MGSLLKFEDFGEAASRRFLTGWCGPLVPEEPTAGHDHRKHTLTWTDCQAPGVLEGCVLTFTQSQWHQGAQRERPTLRSRLAKNNDQLLGHVARGGR